MRLKITESKNAASLYVIESTYIHGKRSSRIVEKLGTLAELSKKHEDPVAWAKEYIEELNQKQAKERIQSKNNATIQIAFNAGTLLSKDTRRCFNGGYLFLQDIFYDLGLDRICETCISNSKAEYNLTEIFSRLIYSRILCPGSKAKTYDFSQNLIEPSEFKQHDLYRALSLLSRQSDYIQSELYKNSKKIGKRNDTVLYYDCTNYYFEIEEEDEFRKYGKAKSHKPNPIVEMGLFMDGDGIPLAFSMHPGNVNEQITMTPLEKKLEKDFGHSKYVVCTDAGLSSRTNKLFNSNEDRAFVTVQSIKKLSNDMKEWALGKSGWKMFGDASEKEFCLDELESKDKLDECGKSVYYEKKFYKEKKQKTEIEVFEDNGEKRYEYIDERIIITFSLQYRDYLKYIRNGQIERAQRLIAASTGKDGKVPKSKAEKRYSQTDFHRFVNSTQVAKSGEIAESTVLTLKNDLINQEEMYDGFYGIATDLADAPEEIIRINQKRWEIEECFRIMKTEFSAEPVYLSREDRIKAHFLTCFVALVVYRYLERKVSSSEHQYSIDNIIDELKEMKFLVSSGNGYIPTYTRTEFTDRLHQVFDFRTDYQIIPIIDMKNIIRRTKS